MIEVRVLYKHKEYRVSVDKFGGVAVRNGMAAPLIAKGTWRYSYVEFFDEMAYNWYLLDAIDAALRKKMKSEMPELLDKDFSTKRGEKEKPEPVHGFADFWS